MITSTTAEPVHIFDYQTPSTIATQGGDIQHPLPPTGPRVFGDEWVRTPTRIQFKGPKVHRAIESSGEVEISFFIHLHIARIQLIAGVDLPGPIGVALWNFSEAVAPLGFDDISIDAVRQIDGILYANHAIVGVSTATIPFVINGGLYARNEAIVYGSGGLTFNYDCRLLGGDSSVAAQHFTLPRTLAPIRTLSWSILEFDPHRVQED